MPVSQTSERWDVMRLFTINKLNDIECRQKVGSKNLE
ncbi:hypothetical protein Nmel_009799 [Mimus melanotis]